MLADLNLVLEGGLNCSVSSRFQKDNGIHLLTEGDVELYGLS